MCGLLSSPGENTDDRDSQSQWGTSPGYIKLYICCKEVFFPPHTMCIKVRELPFILLMPVLDCQDVFMSLWLFPETGPHISSGTSCASLRLQLDYLSFHVLKKNIHWSSSSSCWILIRETQTGSQRGRINPGFHALCHTHKSYIVVLLYLTSCFINAVIHWLFMSCRNCKFYILSPQR